MQGLGRCQGARCLLPLTVQGKDHFAVAARLESIVGERRPDVEVIVDLTVHGEHFLLVGREQWLLTALRVYNAQSLMTEDG